MGVELIVGALTAAAGVAGAVTSYKAGEAQEDALKKQQKEAEKAQAKQEALAIKEKKASDLQLKEGQQRLLKGATGRGGLLYGSELGTGDAQATTLGG